MEKIQKFIRIINRELDRRKKLLSEHGVGTIALYREVTGKQEPTMVILMDSYESMKDEPYETDLFKLFMRISREGLSIGVHLIITASRQNNLRAQLYSNFKHQLTLPQNDISEVRGIVGATPLAATMEDIKGRALMKRDEVDVVQFALPVAGDNDIQIINNLRDQVQSLKEMWTGRTPAGIPMVPDELTEAAFYGREDVAALLDEGEIPVGLDMETAKAMGWNVKRGHLAYILEKEEQMSQITKHLASMSVKLGKKTIILAPEYHQINNIDSSVTLISDKEKLHEMIQTISVKMDDRFAENETNYTTTFIVYNLSEIVDLLNDEDIRILAKLFEKGHQVGFLTVVLATPGLVRKIDIASKAIRNYKQAILAVRQNDQQLINILNKTLREPVLPKQVNYFVVDGIAQTIKVFID